MRCRARCWVFSIVSGLLSACTHPGFNDLVASADAMAEAAGFKRELLTAAEFTLLSYTRLDAGAQTVTIYLEGDGRAWINRRRVSLNPTPLNPLALQLATHDTHSKQLIYLARPCQYRPTLADTACDPVYWTLQRYSDTVVQSLNVAIDQLKTRYRFERVVLAGHSGGGALAVLIAARRTDVAGITTVAANLDTDAFTRWHQVSPLTGSLNPLDVVAAVSHIPQQHFIGEQDSVVPMASIARFQKALANQPCAVFQEVAGATHQSGWVSLWPTVAVQPAPCPTLAE